jgi:aminoglycoside phosphotransferase (APT) family kinase protein
MSVADRLTHTLAHLFWPPIPSSDKDVRLAEYLDREAAARLEIAERATHERIQEGSNTVVRRWATASRGVLFARAWRYDLRRRPAREHQTVNRLFGEAGLQVPRLLLVDDSFATLRRWRVEVSIETAATGRALQEAVETPAGAPWGAIAERLGADLARLHGRTGSVWGKPWQREDAMADPRRYWRGRIEKLGRRCTGRTRELTAEQVGAALKRLGEGLETVALPAPALVHGDLSPPHVFVDGAASGEGEMRLTWIDLQTAHYGHPAEDLALLRDWPLPEGVVEGVFDAYRRAGGSFDGDAMRPAMALFAEWRLWERLSARLVKRQRRGGGETETSDRLDEEISRCERRLHRRLS